MKKNKNRPLKVKIDRAINPFDGSRRRLSSTAHKSKKHYSRKVKHKRSAFSYLWTLLNAKFQQEFLNPLFKCFSLIIKKFYFYRQNKYRNAMLLNKICM